MKWIVVSVAGLVIVLGMLLMLDTKKQVTEAQGASPWIVLQEGLMTSEYSRLRLITIQNKVTGKCFLTKDSASSGLTTITFPEGKEGQ